MYGFSQAMIRAAGKLKISIVVVNLSEQHSLISNWIFELRDIDIQQDRQRFRNNLERIGEIAAYEISKVLPFVETEVETPLGTATSKEIGRASCRERV